MELGNMIFGHSQAHRTYEIERHIGFEGLLECLFETIAPFKDSCYGVYYENETFFTQPYQWDAECTCGLEEEIDNWCESHKHSEDCYQTLVKKEKLKRGWKYDKETNWLEPPEEWSYDKREKVEDEIYKKYCEKFNLPYPNGCAVHCTCYYDKEFKKLFGNREHDFYCLSRIPNFYYKPTKLEIEWYKYPLRDSYSNQEITLLQFKEIIDDCIRSVKEEYEKKNFYNLTLPFGKYKGEKIIEVAQKDINYLWWIFQKTDIKDPHKECLESFFGERLRGEIFDKIEQKRTGGKYE